MGGRGRENLGGAAIRVGSTTKLPPLWLKREGRRVIGGAAGEVGFDSSAFMASKVVAIL